MGIRIGVVSDTHLKQVTEAFKEVFDKHLSDKDVILHAGDVVSAEVVDFLGTKDFHGVCGNMDPSEVKEILPVKKVVELGKYQLGLIHGWGSPFDLENRIWPECSRRGRDSSGQVHGGSGALHRDTDGQERGDKEYGAPFHGAVGLFHLYRPEED